jgi:uncharacterized protein (TIGR02569 family)
MTAGRRAVPPPAVLAAFGLTGPLAALPGGQQTSWRVADAVVKPLDADLATVAWRSSLLSGLDGRSDFRISAPLRARDGSWAVAGWTASTFQPGEHLPGRWHDIIGAGRRLHAAVAGVARPAFLAGRKDPWAVADRVAWGELPAGDFAGAGPLEAMIAALRPVPGRCQLVHGDLTGNVLFADGQPPLILDLSPYWRPPEFADAIVLADALVFEHAGAEVVAPWRTQPWFGQYLLRALIFRLVTAHIAGTEAEGIDSYRAAAELALWLTHGA